MKRTRRLLICLITMISMFAGSASLLAAPPSEVLDEFPIGIYYGPWPADTNDASYAEIRDMNANFIVGWNNKHVTLGGNLFSLDLAEKHGLKVLVDDLVTTNDYKTDLITQLSANDAWILRNDKTLGQTFTTPAGHIWDHGYIGFKLADTGMIPGTTMTLSIYDSPNKTTLIVSETTNPLESPPYVDFNMGKVAYQLSPETEYYMELTTTSTADVSLAVNTTDVYDGGQAYSQGQPQNGDFLFYFYIATVQAPNYTYDYRPSDELLDQVVNLYKDHPAYMGMHLRDEPPGEWLPKMKEIQDTVRQNDPNHLAYFNMLLGGSKSVRTVPLTSAQTVGQTFKTKPNQTTISYIQAGIDKAGWGANESVKLTLWDSPSKATKIAERTLTGTPDSSYPMFKLNAAVNPDTSYYMEFSIEPVNGSVSVYASQKGVDWDSNGTAYQSGQPADFDLWFTVDANQSGEIQGDFVTSSNRIGQTFKTAANQTAINWIQLYIDNETWSTGEVLTLTLWDSPSKTSKIAESSIDTQPNSYFPKFRLNAAVTPDSTYYMELTHNGGGDNRVGLVIRSKDGVNWVEGGNEYINGVPINADLWFAFDADVRRARKQDQVEAYIRQWSSYNPDVISYDAYPFYVGSFDIQGMYEYLEQTRSAALDSNKDLWMYIQSTGQDGAMTVPNEAQLRYQIYPALAYGVKGYMYFTYNTVPYMGFHDALILPDGTRNDTYDWAKQINGEVLKLGPTLLSLKSQAVYHTGSEVFRDTTVLPADFLWQVTDRSQPTITGYFTDEAGKKYIMAVNRDFENGRTISFSLPAKPASVKEVSKTTGLETATNYDSASGTLSASFAPGEGRLYVLDESSASEANVASLTADAASVSAGSTFKVKYGLSSVAQNVYAQDIKLHYDPAAIEFVSAKSIKQGVGLLETANDQAGNLQMILASAGPGNEVTGQAELVELTFKAKHVSQTAASEIKLTSARLADSNGIEYEAALSSVNIQVIAGISGDLNHDNKVTIGDLAIMAAHYGKNTNSPDWEQVKQSDLNGDGKIDIEDLAALARKIIG